MYNRPHKQKFSIKLPGKLTTEIALRSIKQIAFNNFSKVVKDVTTTNRCKYDIHVL